MDNPWSTLGSREVYRNKWIRIREDSVIRPDGNEGIYGVVEVPYAAGTVVINPDLEVYLIRQWRYTHNISSLEIPVGSSCSGETPKQTAQRELREETGLSAEQWIDLGVVRGSIGATNDRTYVFLAREVSLKNARPDGNEKIRVQKIPLRKAVEMVMRGEITEAASSVALLKAARHLGI